MNFTPERIRRGERLKRAALTLLGQTRAVTILRGRRALLGALLKHGSATADDVRGVVELPDGVSPKLFGVVPGTLARLGIIESAGFTKSRRPTAHARPIQTWRLVDRSGALCWLATHRDRPDLPTQTEEFDGDPWPDETWAPPYDFEN